MSLMLLAQQGKISLDDPLRKYLPELPDYGAAPTIRFRCEVGIVSADGQRAFFREGSGSINYGLITVLTKKTDAGPRRTMLFAGINSDGSDAAMDHLTSLFQLADLARELKRPSGEIPGSFQVVVRSRSSDTRTLQSEQVAIQILR